MGLSHQVVHDIGRAISLHQEGLQSEAYYLARQARDLATNPGHYALASLVSGVAQTWVCRETADWDECVQALEHYNDAEQVSQYCETTASQVVTANQQNYDYTCQALTRLAHRFRDNASPLIEELAHEVVIEDQAFQPTNRRSIQTAKLDPELTRQMKFDPPLETPTTIPLAVYEELDPLTSQWQPLDKKLFSYHQSFETEMTYTGPLLFCRSPSQGLIQASSLLALPVPKGYEVSAASVLINGEANGFDVVRSAQGIFYLAIATSVPTNSQLEFGLRRQRSRFWQPEPTSQSYRVLVRSSLWPDVAGQMIAAYQFSTAEQKYQHTNDWIQSELAYPNDADVQTGRALFLAQSSDEFVDAVLDLHLADCDVANTLGVALLRQQGVAAQLVTGLYVGESGVGCHGWLQYWDDERQQWVNGDMTPAIEGSAVEDKDNNDQKLAPFTLTKYQDRLLHHLPLFPVSPSNPNALMRDLPFDDQWAKTIAWALEGPNEQELSLLQTLAFNTYRFFDKIPITRPEAPHYTSPVENFWTFTGGGFRLSEPAGRYVVKYHRYQNNVEVYDLETRRRWSIEASVFDAKEDGMHAFETNRGLMLLIDQRRTSSNPNPKAMVIDEKGHLVGMQEGLNVSDWLIFLKQDPYVVFVGIELEGSRSTSFHIAGVAEDNNGQIQVVVWHDHPYQDITSFYLKTYGPADLSNRRLVMTPNDFDHPVFQYNKDDSFNSVVFSPTASHYAVMVDDDSNKKALIFKGTTLQATVAWDDDTRGSNEYEVVRLSDDGELSLKRVMPYQASVWHFDADGKEQKHLTTRWQIVPNPQAPDFLVKRFDAQATGAIDVNMEGYRDLTIRKVSWDGRHLTATSSSESLSHTRWIFWDGDKLVHQSVQGSHRLYDDLPAGFGSLSEDAFHLYQADKAMVYPHEMPGRMHNYHAYMRLQSQTTRWQVERSGVGLPDKSFYTFIHRQEDRLNYVAREMWSDYQKHGQVPPLPLVAGLLAGVLAHPEQEVLPEWLVMGASHLFKAQLCEDESQDCEWDQNRVASFGQDYGCSLATRLADHLAAPLPDPTTPLQAASFLMQACSENVLEPLVASDADLAAEAIVLSLERRLMTAENLAPLPSAVESKLIHSLRRALTKRRQKFTSPHYAEQALRAAQFADYQLNFSQLEDQLGDRYGEIVRGRGVEKDW